MNTRSPRVWLIDIREEIAGIQGLTKEADIAAFSASWAMKRAVKHALLIIAEAAKNLPQSMKEARHMGSATCCATSIVTSIPKCCGQLKLVLWATSTGRRRRCLSSCRTGHLVGSM